MRDWVIPSLKEKGDDKISEEELGRELLIPIFCFRRLANYFDINFSANTRLVELFGSVISDLPFEIFYQLAMMRNLFFFFSDAYAYIQALNFVEGKQGIICMFSEKLLSLTDCSVRGTLAHELGHIISGHYNAEVQELKTKAAMEMEADSMAKVWGFEFEIQTVRGFLKSKSLI